MTAYTLAAYREIWLVDFEFGPGDGERPEPRCMVAREFRTGRLLRLWADELAALPAPPFAIGDDSLFVAYYASAELGCFLALGWPMPARTLDLCAEFKCLTSGLEVPCGRSLLGALTYHGIDGIGAVEKDGMRQLALRGGEYSEAERVALLDYCQSDVDALAKLLPAMLPKINPPRALLRGRYMAAAASMEWAGVPIDAATLGRLREHWPAIKSRLVAAVDTDYGCYVPSGAKRIDPGTTLGDAILGTAADYGIDPYTLGEALDYIHTEEREATADHLRAVAAARKATGLSVGRIAAWERAGKDSATWPALDTQARTLAGELPALGIGIGYEQEAVADDTDYAGGLWELLREPERKTPPKHDPSLLRRAAELVAAGNADRYSSARSMTFSMERFAAYLIRHNIAWPRTEKGLLATDDDTFRSMAKAYPFLHPLRELRHALSDLRLERLAVGRDNRNRTVLWAFGAQTGRNAPKAGEFIFGPSVWLRGLIKPAAGMAVAYVDWEQQEFGIAAALSGDKAMIDAYDSGDPYLTFAKQAGAVPSEATKASHKAERERFKVCALAVQYGMAERSLAQAIGQSEAHARELLRLHRQTYPAFWRWSEAAVMRAMLHGWLQTVFGWRVHVGSEANPRSLANFPCQANGAEMLRLACCLATERGVTVCCPIHDAVLLEAPADEIERAVADCQAAMQEASEVVLSGFALRTDAKIVAYPERYSDPRGERMWEIVMGLLTDLEREREAAETGDPWAESGRSPVIEGSIIGGYPSTLSYYSL
jgi:hypothetical protein